ncbi:MAG: LamG-like jellyroll fold domain-containing protein [Minisyncoccales bacterium]|jgi:prepilin-type N-terminal cleavage/methylation domain-containing protein
MITKNRNKSFTLIELLVVIVIIGILAGVIMISTSSSINKANFAKAQAFSSTVQNELLSNLVSEWTFNNVSNIGEDTWGSNHGTVVGASQVDDCVFGKCCSFDGTDDYIEIVDSQEMRMVQGGTITAWIYPKTIGEVSGRIIDKSISTSSADGFMFYLAPNNKLILGIESSRIHSSNNAITLNAWNFAVAIFNSSEKHLYVNGVDVTESGGDLTTLPKNIAGAVRIGNRAGATDRSFNGRIDDLRIYNAVLSSAQIKQNYISGLDSLLGKSLISKREYNQRLNELAYEE